MDIFRTIQIIYRQAKYSLSILLHVHPIFWKKISTFPKDTIESLKAIVPLIPSLRYFVTLILHNHGITRVPSTRQGLSLEASH